MRCATVPVIVAALLAVAGCGKQKPGDAQPGSTASASLTTPPAPPETTDFTGKIDRSHKGQQLPELTFADPAGKKLALKSLLGKPVLINMWATWCIPCIKEMPTLETLAAAPAGIRVVTISEDMKNSVAKVAPLFAAKGFKALHPWLDPDNDLGFQLSSGDLPTSILYDAKGHEVWRMVGGHDWSSADTARLLAEAKG